MLRVQRTSWRSRVWLAISAILLGGFVWLLGNADLHRAQAVFLDVGQGDATLIFTSSGQTVLVDGGPDNILLKRLGEWLPFFHRRLDYVIISHFHDDHITGLISVVKRYDVGEVIYAHKIESAASRELDLWLQRRSVPVRRISNETVLSFSPDCRLRLISPEALVSDYDENDSLISHFNCGPLSILLTGDNRQEVEQSLVARFSDLKSDVFKAAHHGSKTANSLALLKAIEPRLMVISVGDRNRFGHPHAEVLDRAKSLGVEVRRTDEQGSQVIRSQK